ncbi:MAG: MBL fold metallo-hydrolase [Eubacteriales bacterium]
MKVADGLEMLELSANLFTGPSIIHPALVYDKDEVILVDAGFPGQLSIIREAVEKAGFHFGKLSKIIITHHDIDHIGSLSDIFKESPQKPFRSYFNRRLLTLDILFTHTPFPHPHPH